MGPLIQTFSFSRAAQLGNVLDMFRVQVKAATADVYSIYMYFYNTFAYNLAYVIVL